MFLKSSPFYLPDPERVEVMGGSEEGDCSTFLNPVFETNILKLSSYIIMGTVFVVSHKCKKRIKNKMPLR